MTRQFESQASPAQCGQRFRGVEAETHNSKIRIKNKSSIKPRDTSLIRSEGETVAVVVTTFLRLENPFQVIIDISSTGGCLRDGKGIIDGYVSGNGRGEALVEVKNTTWI